MAKKKETNTSEFRLYNTNLNFKKLCIRLAASEGTTLTPWAIRHLRAAANNYPDSAKNYKIDDDGC